jgi:hypothetical protein
LGCDFLLCVFVFFMKTQAKVSALVQLEHTLFELSLVLLVLMTCGAVLLLYRRQPDHPYGNAYVHWVFKHVVQDDVDFSRLRCKRQ